jgi:glycosyltransferase involved in cell wall biosynthesis
VKIIHVTTSDMSLRYLLLDQLKFLRSQGHDVRAVSGPGPWVSEVRAAGIPVATMALTRRIAPFQDLLALAELTWHLLRMRPDVIHTHTPKASLLGQWASALVRVRHRVHTIHGLYFPGHMRPERRWLYVWLERIQMAPAHLILSQNAEDLDTVRRDRIADPTKLRFLGNGIDVTRFTPANATAHRRAAVRAELGIPPGDQVVGMVGRLVREKGYPELFEAAARILRERPNTTFIAIGGAEPTKADGVSADDPMEAAATGVPVVATDVRGCRDTVIEGETGHLVPVRDPNALAAAIIDVLQDEGRRSAMGARSRALAEERFDQRLVFQRVADAYAALEGKPR